MSATVITLTTDFGEKSGYVGVMKGVIYSLYPEARLVDLSHQVLPQNILEGAFLLHTAYRYFPIGTLHVAVVDPGVGTERLGVVLQVPEIGYFIGPDNGLFSYIVANHPTLTARLITNPAFMRLPLSNTFHGRDIFAPTAAQLANGVAFEEVGPLYESNNLIKLANLQPTITRNLEGEVEVLGQIVHIDHFGNLVTNIPQTLFFGLSDEQLSEVVIEIRVKLGGPIAKIKGISKTYGQARPGELVALFGSSNFLEIAKVNGRADSALNTTINQPVRIITQYLNFRC